MKAHHILITGIGGTNSLAVLKALRQSNMPHRAIGTDIKPLTAGVFLTDAAYLVPPVADTHWRTRLESIIKQERIDIIFATTEVEILSLAKIKPELEKQYGVIIMTPELKIVEMCQDKLATQEFLRENDFTYIPTITTASKQSIDRFVEEYNLPLISKPRRGYGSRGVEVIENLQDLQRVPHSEDQVLQQYIQSDSSLEFEEFTTEVFVNSDGTIAGGIVLQRTLANGESRSGKVVRDSEALTYLEQIAKKLGIKGPCNFQYRKAHGKLYIFEINARYSGTTAVRAHFGFNNVSLALKSFLEKKHLTISQGQITEGYFVRYWEEAYLPINEMRSLINEGNR